MNLDQIINYLKQNQVVAYPTEAVFGLGCNPMSEQAVQQLLAIKKRSIEKGLIVIAPSIELLQPFIDEKKMQAKHWQRLQKHYSHPITWVVPAHKDVPMWLTGKFDSIAVRLCDHPAVQQLCQGTGFALTSTSANLSGFSPCITAQQVLTQFGEHFPVLNQPVGQASKPSEIRDIFSQQIFRQG
ncbi:MAG: Sua5/YciO/YrdC/YwlC family protein [Pasteurellaceae bacterium]|nr:Sua5/YciO/YrdC/YwlC family protein [Pasteurellaceae bacterium]